MKQKRVLALILCILLCFCFGGCKSNGEAIGDTPINEAEQNAASLNLLYCSNDSFNPYTLISKVNLELTQLLFDPLYKTDNNFNAIPVLAESAVREGNSWHITIKSATFTDGTTLSTKDVIYSFNLAKNSIKYASSLSHIQSVSENGNTVIFNLTKNDPYFCNVLSFPILKEGSDNLRDEDSVLLPPIGTGRYILDLAAQRINRNENYFGAKPTVPTAVLINAPDNESAWHYVEVGATDFYYADTTQNEIVRMSGQKLVVNRNNLVYLGINTNNTPLSNVYLRYAVSSAIDRERIVSSVYFSNAVAATGPFHPNWSVAKDYQTTQTSAKTQIAIENLEKIGYNKVNEGGYRVNQSGYELTLNLLINADNPTRVSAANLIAANLKAVGIKLNITALPFESYKAALENGQFELYLGECVIDMNFNLEPLVVPGGSCAYGVTATQSAEAVSIPQVMARYNSGEVAISDVITAIQSDMTFIPLCYRSAVLFYNNNITNLSCASADDLFFDIDKIIITDN